MSVMQTMQLMMAVKAAIAGIANVGSKATYGILTPTTAGAYVAAFALPAGSAAGDTATISAEAAGIAGFVWGTLPGATAALSQTMAGYQLSAQVYKLAQADIDAGTLSVPYTISTSGSWSIRMTGVVDVDRSVGGVDVVGTYATGTGSGTTNCTLPGVTTALDGDVVRYAFFSDKSSASSTITQPVGFTSGDQPFSVNSGASFTGYMKQLIAGAAGDAVIGYSYPNVSYSWAGVLIALKPVGAPISIALTGTFGAGTVGVPWTGALTFTGAYGASITMDVAAGTMPAWIGTPVIDYTAKTVTYSGTPTTATSISFTPRATPAVGTAATAPQTFAIAAAASSGPAFVQGNSLSQTVANPSVSLAATATAGNQLIATMVCGDYPAPAAPSGWTAVSVGASGYLFIWAYKKISDGTETGIAFPITAKGRTLVITEWRGAKVGTQTTKAVSEGPVSTEAFGPSNSPVSSNAIPFITVGWNYSAASAAFSSPWVQPTPYVYQNMYGGAYAYAPAQGGPASGVVTAATSVSHVFISLNLWIEPA